MYSCSESHKVVRGPRLAILSRLLLGLPLLEEGLGDEDVALRGNAPTQEEALASLRASPWSVPEKTSKTKLMSLIVLQMERLGDTYVEGDIVLDLWLCIVEGEKKVASRKKIQAPKVRTKWLPC